MSGDERISSKEYGDRIEEDQKSYWINLKKWPAPPAPHLGSNACSAQLSLGRDKGPLRPGPPGQLTWGAPVGRGALRVHRKKRLQSKKGGLILPSASRLEGNQETCWPRTPCSTARGTVAKMGWNLGLGSLGTHELLSRSRQCWGKERNINRKKVKKRGIGEGRKNPLVK